MNTKETLSHEELDKFLSWFSTFEEVSLETRRDFFAHLLKVRHFDEKSKAFIESTLETVAEKSEKQAQELERRIQQLENLSFLQKQPEMSLGHKIAKNVCVWMNEKAERFKKAFRAKEKNQAQKEESREEAENQFLVDQLKSSLSQ